MLGRSLGHNPIRVGGIFYNLIEERGLGRSWVLGAPSSSIIIIVALETGRHDE